MKKILLLTTGGTISCGNGEGALAPALRGSELLGFIDTDGAEIEISDLLFIDSTAIKPGHWELIAGELRRRMSDFDGFVITHGTDTLAYTSAMLSFMLCNADKPIIITGSMKTMYESESDAPKNLSDAIKTAECGISGVYVVFGGRIIHGTRAYKSSSSSADGFVSLGAPYAGEIKDGRAVFFAGGAPPRAVTEFEYGGESLSAKTAVITVVPSDSGELIRLCADSGYKGIVMCGYGSGGIPDDKWSKAIEYAASRGVVTVMASQCRNGAIVHSRYAVGGDFERLGIISARDMTIECAYCKLLLLASVYKSDTNRIRSEFEKNICGELAE